MASLTRIAILDDHPVFREGTAALLRAVPGMEVVAATGNPADVLALAAQGTVDVVVLDVRLANGSGLDVLSDLRKTESHPAIVVFTAYDYPQYAQAAVRLGAAGFVPKTAPTEELVAVIRRVEAGGLHVWARRGDFFRPLTPRERELVALVVEGLSNDEVAGRLAISRSTVETYLRRLFAAYGLASRTELASRALREGWLEVPSSR